MGPKFVFAVFPSITALTSTSHRKFWRQVLPKLKYHNPSVSMNVEHTVQPGDPATLAVFFHSKQSTAGSSRAPPAQTSSDTSGQTSGPSDRADSSSVMKTIAMKDKHSDDILREFIELTNAKQVESTAADQAMLEELRESEEAGARHRAQSAILKAERMREQASLKAAQQEAIASTTAVTEQ